MKENILSNKNLIIAGIICLVIGCLFGSNYGNYFDNKMNKEMAGMEMDHSNMDHGNMTADEIMKMDGHKHSTIPVGYRIPTIKMEAAPDTMGGFNVHIETTNFTFTPQNAGKDNTPNTGHAHIFVNGKKIGRVYGNWYYAGADKFTKGENVISVTLNGNNHDVWVLQDGETEITATTTVVVQ